MIGMRRHEELQPPSVEFDPYVPFMASWHGAREVLDTPIYVVMNDRNGCLELKFHPHDRYLIEVVLVAAAGVQVKDEALSPVHSGIHDLVPILGSEGTGASEKHSLDIKAYRDYLCVAFEGEPAARWVGVGPVLFGQSSDGGLVAICVRWDEPERESLLTGSGPV